MIRQTVTTMYNASCLRAKELETILGKNDSSIAGPLQWPLTKNAKNTMSQLENTKQTHVAGANRVIGSDWLSRWRKFFFKPITDTEHSNAKQSKSGLLSTQL